MSRQLCICLAWISVTLVGALPQGLAQQALPPGLREHPGDAPPVSFLDPNHPSQTDKADTFVLRAHTDLVQVPAVISDKSGHHLHDLTKTDFTVLEDGKPQRIAFVEEVNVAGTPSPELTHASDTFSNQVLNEQQGRGITIIVLDTINTPYLSQSNGRRELIKYLAATLDSQHSIGLMVIGSKGVKVLEGFNSDPAALIAALKKATGEISAMQGFGTDGTGSGSDPGLPIQLSSPMSPVRDADNRMRDFILRTDSIVGYYQQTQAIEDTMNAFLAIAWSLSGVPGRKSLIWATGSFPFSLDSPASMPRGGLAPLYQRTLQALNDAQVSVYPVDVRGLVSRGGGGNRETYIDVQNMGTFGRPATGDPNWLLNSSLDSMRMFAEMTGGRAYLNNNDLATGYRRAVDDSSSYYLLSYYPDHHKTAPGWRKLQVKVAREDVEVHARTGYLVTNATTDPRKTHDADLRFALSSPFDSTAIPLTVQWLGKTPDGDRTKVGFVMRLTTNGVIDEADQNRFDIDFLAQATKASSTPVQAGQSVKGTMQPDVLAKVKKEGIYYTSVLDLPSGDYQVRFVVRDNLRGKVGTVSAPLTVK